MGAKSAAIIAGFCLTVVIPTVVGMMWPQIPQSVGWPIVALSAAVGIAAFVIAIVLHFRAGRSSSPRRRHMDELLDADRHALANQVTRITNEILTDTGEPVRVMHLFRGTDHLVDKFRHEPGFTATWEGFFESVRVHLDGLNGARGVDGENPDLSVALRWRAKSTELVYEAGDAVRAHLLSEVGRADSVSEATADPPPERRRGL